ncbi:cardiolipin synthase [Exiguobacterium sp. s193]|uniref:cardiolipin synthase n=1 Tax=Exiguobacterium sp. s193 TaxID=2751207 RepID=UPI002036F83F|nr:cardiolipin synthase [Exiguobacterium sp. s193]
MLELLSTFTVVLVFGLFIMNLLAVLTVIFLERRDIGSTWAWVLVLYFIPLVGFLIYVFFGRLLKKKEFYHIKEEERLEQRRRVSLQIAELNHSGELRQEYPMVERYNQLIQMNLNSNGSLLSLKNKVTILSDGEQKFNRMMTDIMNAKHEINIQYYIIQKDSLGLAMIEALTNMARQGVKVRLLYDAVGSRDLKRRDFKDLLHHGGEVFAFFPPTLGLINFRMNNRNHRKSCIIDGQVGYIGGFNVGTEYFGIDEKFGYWRDTHFRLEGEVVHDQLDRFILDWNEANDIYTDKTLFYYGTHEIKKTLPMQIVTSGPDSETEHLKNLLIKMITLAKKTVMIQSPYFIPDTSYLDACKMALLSGVDVRIMIPNKPDHPFVYWATTAAAGELIAYGAKIYTYEPGFLHAKTIVVDGEIASVGTTNIDARSFRLNFEMNSIVYDMETARELEQLFLTDCEASELLTAEKYAGRSRMIKFKESISRLLSPIL